MKCRQGNHQLDNQSVSQRDWEAGSQSVRQSVSQSVRHSLISYAVSSGNQVAACHLPPPTASCIFQAPRQRAKLAARVNMFTKPRPLPHKPQQQQEQQPPKLTKCQQSRHCGSMERWCCLSFRRKCHTQYTDVISSPCSSPFHSTFTDDTWQYANVTFVASQIRQNVDKFFA